MALNIKSRASSPAQTHTVDKNAHILIVDGNAERLSAILKILIDGGYGRVETLTSPYALIERIAKSRPETLSPAAMPKVSIVSPNSHN